MKQLQDILYKVRIQSVHGSLNRQVSGLAIDSRLVENQSTFIAIRGDKLDGHDFIANAINQGATSIICEKLPENINSGITYVEVKNTHEAAAYMSVNFFGSPASKIKLTGVTGTNGKTTIATLLFRLFTSLQFKCGLISTVQNQIGNEILPATHTTPDAISLNALLKQMVDAGCQYVFMECSSHAIQQERITGLEFAGGIFSNITHDHLDYHKTFDAYLKVKKRFFDNLPATAFALSNLDDKRGRIMLQNTNAAKFFYSMKEPAEFKGKILENALDGLTMMVNDKEVHFRLIGEFNAYNLLAVYGAAVRLGQQPDDILLKLSRLKGAEGRFDQIHGPSGELAIIDYAHTPDALENVLKTIDKLRSGNEKVFTVVGCGGDRDATKRPEMAQIASEYSDTPIFTSDNPRSEDPEAILEDMRTGLNSAGRRKSLFITDRKEAIKKAVNAAQKGDIILVAGKGHEKYQIIKGQRIDFDDKLVIEKFFEQKRIGKNNNK